MTDAMSEVATALYSSGCLKFGSYHLKSGAPSQYYIDLACLLSSPRHFSAVTDIAASGIRRLAASARIDKLASIELKGALLLANLCDRTGLPCVVVRKEEKAYGSTGRIAGANITMGEHLLFFDDVVSEGLSKLEGIRPLEELGAKIENIMVVVDREQGGKESLESLGYKVHALARISQLTEILLDDKLISQEQAGTVLSYIRK